MSFLPDPCPIIASPDLVNDWLTDFCCWDFFWYDSGFWRYHLKTSLILLLMLMLMLMLILMLILMLMFNLTLIQGKARLGLFLPVCSAWWASITIFCVESDFFVCSVHSEHGYHIIYIQCTFSSILPSSGVGWLRHDHCGLVHGQSRSLPRPW